ncbi:MAG: hypothetical protein A2V66_03170 [Ignavibacteria bacterium RBG_13_36_8]|nr:MAG: hypothetical protein A2V66_03170 [Ignavibacteria bacterium RBG_13_36_8]
MSDHEKHIYMIVFPINALVASQLSPEKFGEHYIIGSARHFRGKVIFTEIDINFRDPYFEIDKFLNETTPHEDGSPKKTKFIKSYNVLEHMDLDAIKTLFLCTPNGKVLPLQPNEFSVQVPKGILRIYQEIIPLENLVASNLDQREFGMYITRKTVSKGAPKMFFAQVEFNVEKFLERNKNGDLFQVDLPNVNPYHFYESIVELNQKPDKKTKTITLGSILGDLSYRCLRHGFWFIDGDKIKFFPMPTEAELEDKYFYWLKFVK